MTEKYVIGLDFGTDSVRAMVVNAHKGDEVATAVSYYPRWAKGLFCNPDKSQFRQHPLDYLESMEECLIAALNLCPEHIKQNIAGISADTTGSTPVAVDNNCTPLALLPQFSANPNAMFVLWKDHTAHAEADEINALAAKWGTNFTCYSGGVYSPEWYWSKILHITRTDAEVANAACTWVEHCDWIPAVLTGQTNLAALKRSRCAAGHKAMWHESFPGLPEDSFLNALHPLLAQYGKYSFTETYTSDTPAGTISKAWAQKLGLPASVIIGTGALDAHFGAIGAYIQPNTVVKVLGTSTCDMVVVAPETPLPVVKGICGQVNGSIIPGMPGLEAGQSAFGDLYKWFEELLMYPLKQTAGLLDENITGQLRKAILPALNHDAALLPVTEDDEIALDWINGRRTPDADLLQTATIAGLSLGTTAPKIFKALVEATAFGSRAINERFENEGVPVEKVVVLGGISRKSDYVVQTLANVLGKDIYVVKSDQACALGATMFAATAAGIYPDVGAAQEKMNSGFDKVFKPDTGKHHIYNKLYQRYKRLGA